jgi:UMF1 family MFS transporter
MGVTGLSIDNALAGNDRYPKRGAFGHSVLLSWCLYDWANSAFPAVISTFVFAVYFTESVAESPVSGSVLWSQAVTGAGLAIALLSPIFGAIADQTGRQKVWLITFTMICVTACGLLWFVKPDPADVGMALMLYIISATAFGIAMVFYDCMLTRLVAPGFVGRLSGIGWAAGYLGGLLCLLGVLFALVEPESALLEFDREQGEHFRAASLFVALWYLIFSIPLFVSKTELPVPSKSAHHAVSHGLQTLAKTLKTMPDQPEIGRFLLAHMFATNGVTTLILFGGVYAAGTFGFEISEILTFAIALYVFAGIGAAGFGWLDDRIGSKRVLIFALAAILVLVAGLVLATNKTQFWILGTTLGVFIGPAQSSSRSLMARLTPPDMAAEFFGLYSLAGKITVFVGPLLFGLLTGMAHSQRAGFAVIALFLAAGILILKPLHEPVAEKPL